MTAPRGPAASEAEINLLVQRCKDLMTARQGDVVPTHWNPIGWTNDAMELAAALHQQVTLCDRAVRVADVVEYFADYQGHKMLALRYAICRAALA